MYVIKRAPGVRIWNEDFTPNRTNSSCQEMDRQYLMCCAMGASGGSGCELQAAGVNYDGSFYSGSEVNCKESY